MTALVETLLRGLGVSWEPGDLEERAEEGAVTVTVRLSRADLARVDGTDHRLAKAVRQALSAAATARQTRYHLVVRAKA